MSSPVYSMEKEWRSNLPFVVGETIIWHGGSPGLGSKVKIKQGFHHGKVRWVGKIEDVGSSWVVGLEMEKVLKGGGDGAWQTKPIFTCKAGHGLFLPADKLVQTLEKNSSPKSSARGKCLNEKEEKNTSSKETILAAPQQNGPQSQKHPPGKGGANLINESQVPSSKDSVGTDQPASSQKCDSKRDGRSNSVKSMFNSLSRKDKNSQEVPNSKADQPKSQKGGFLNIFKWFSRKESLKRRKDSNEKMSGRRAGSTTSLVSNSSSITFFPIRHSVSADNSNTMMKSYNTNSSSKRNPPHKEEGASDRRSSIGSTVSSSSSNIRSKKRMAPRPPQPLALNASRSASELNHGFSPSTKAKAQSESPVYSKVKRKAPPPPDKYRLGPKVCGTTTQGSTDNSNRPVSTFSNFSYISNSGSSTLKSSTCSENDSLTLKSDSSQKTTSSFPVCKDGKGPLSPKPWYKRKIKAKEKSSKSVKKEKELVYESWMPDIQYSRKSIISESLKISDKQNDASQIETFYDKRPKSGQRFSILSSISDLDRAATEQFERDKAQKMAVKMEYDQTFYNLSSPHMLSQEDLVPGKKTPRGAEALIPEEKSDNVPASTTYDNLHYNGAPNTMSLSYSKQPTLKLTDSSPIVDNNQGPSAPDISLFDDSLVSEIYSHYESSGKVNYEEYVEEIRKELEQEATKNNPKASVAKSTPMQRAIFDPELFYQLAKEAKVNCSSKISNSEPKSSGENVTKSKASERTENSSPERSPSNYRLRPPLKNFGLRMNNFFTPDVSTIMEGSESVTSSNTTTTPAEDTIEDLYNRSAMSIDHTNDIMSLNSELNSEYRINTCDLQEIIESFSLDLRRGEREARDSLNEDPELVNRRKRADQIRDEVLLLREKDNFQMWQKAMQETELTREDDQAAIEERKKKWVCESCTLINQPWRLHCEACGSLRPPNPKRISPNDPRTSPGSLCTVSNDSPVTVIHDDRVGADIYTEGNEPESLPSRYSRLRSDVEGTPNTNWERELQSYFTVFDDEANAIRDIDSEAHNIRSNDIEDSSNYGRINFSKSKNAETGAKPKGRLDECNGVDMQELRKARIRKFQLNYNSSQEQPNFSSNPLQYNNNRAEILYSGVQDKINQLSEMLSNDSKPKASDVGPSSRPSRPSDMTPVFQNEDEKKFYKNEYKKSPVMKPSGAVKSAVSIFNQLDQLKAVQEKTPPAKVKTKRSVTNILNFSDFERLISGGSNEHATPSVRTTSPIIAEVDIASAISKFDEMAAMAEIDGLRKPMNKVQKKWFKPEIQHHSINEVHSAKQNPPYQSAPEGSSPIQLRNHVNSGNLRVENRDSCDSIIRDGILYTTGESRRRSMSIGSGTFELIKAKDFASIEAHHSRRPSPTEEFDGPSMSELSHPLLMPEINIETPEVFSNRRIVKESNESLDETDVERLSRLLTEVEGIATFKATLATDEPRIGLTNTKLISRLLKQLEDAISKGRHAEASRLAHDLAKMQLSFSVANKLLSKDDPMSRPSAPTPQGALIKNNMNYDGNQDLQGAQGVTLPVEIERNQEVTPNVTPNVVKRVMKVDPARREVKSDITSSNLVYEQPVKEDNPFIVKMYVEDKASHQGPIAFSLCSSMTVGDLKMKVCEEFGFPFEVQRWILGRLLADDDSKTLSSHSVTAEGCPIFLYLVAPETDTKPTSPKLSRSSSVTSNPKSETDGRPIVKEENNESVASKKREIVSVKSKERLNQAGSKDSTQVKQKKTQVSSSKSDPSKNRNKEAERKSPKNKSLSNPNEKRSGESKLARPSDTRRNRLTEQSAKHNSRAGDANSVQTNHSLHPSKTEETSPTIPAVANGWTCPQCTLINHKDRPGCEACSTERPEADPNHGQKPNLRQATFALDAQGCVPNLEPFECRVCFLDFQVGEGVILRDCLHEFCRDCLTNSVKFSDTARVRCPFSDKNYSCQFSLQEREIKDLLTEEDYKKHLDKSVKEAAGSMQNVFYCKTPDCKGFCQFEDNVNVFHCAVCRKFNCLTCQAQHEGVTCKQYQDDLANKQDEDALKTKKFFDEIIRRGDGIPCPQCSVMLVRKWGCDWMKCPMCRTEICWVTRGPRWGPDGPGDTSGGCKCGLYGRKCHPKCTYCH